jgi:glutathione S-transferase
MRLKLYDGLGPNPFIVRMFAAEKAITLDRVPIDIGAGENRAPAFLARNPLGQLPALELPGGLVIAEVVAICELLDELYPQPALIGDTAHDRAETRMWVRRFDLGVIEPMMMGARATAMRPFFEPRMTLLPEEAGRAILGIAAENLARLDRLLDGRTWVCGERFSLADIFAGGFVLTTRRVGLPIDPALRWMPGWLERLEARPSARA